MTYKHTEKMTKNNAWFCDENFSYTSIANIVAGLLGFDGAWKNDAMGFRNTWIQLKWDGKFDNCKTIGDFKTVYLNKISN
jgi:hypothetical protein